MQEQASFVNDWRRLSLVRDTGRTQLVWQRNDNDTNV